MGSSAWHRRNRHRLNVSARSRRKTKGTETAYRHRQRRSKRDRYLGIIAELRKGPCVDCGLVDHRVMDFDHCRGTKKFSIGDVTRQSNSLSNLLTEIAKCDLVCANCHRIRGWNRRTGGTS